VFVASRVDVPGAWQMPQVLCFGFLWSVFAPLRKQGIQKTRNLFLWVQLVNIAKHIVFQHAIEQWNYG
jgi:hypothetical protein